METKIWMKVTNDEYELPVMVAGTARELAQMAGCTEDSIRTMASRGTGSYKRVEVEEEEE